MISIPGKWSLVSGRISSGEEVLSTIFIIS